MAVKIHDKYTSRANPADANYPTGSFKNRSVPGVLDGTPMEKSWANDWLGSRDAFLKKAGIDANGKEDTADNSQLLDAVNTTTMYHNGEKFFGVPVVPLKNGMTIKPVNNVYPKVIAFNELFELTDNSVSYTVKSFAKSVDSNSVIITLNDNQQISALKVDTASREWSKDIVTKETVSAFSNNTSSELDNKFAQKNGDIERLTKVTSDLYGVTSKSHIATSDKTSLEFLSSFAQQKTSKSFWSGHQINIIGDSISQAAFSQDNLNNLWNSIVKKNINYELDESSYGFVSLAQGGFVDNSNAEIHTVTLNGNWTKSNTDTASPCGYSVSSSTLNNDILIKVPVFQDIFDIWYLPIYTGACRVYINDVQAGGLFDLSGDGSYPNKLKSSSFGLKNSGDGYCYIKIVVASNIQVKFFGIQYRNYGDATEINNFSHSGRKLTHLSDAMINLIFGSPFLCIMALGHNDFTDADRDDVYFNNFITKLNKVAQICNSKGVKLIVCDFCWHKSIEQSRSRKALHDMQYAVESCKYLPIPDYFYTDDTYLSYPDMKTKMHLFDDWSHPNPLGHKLIGEIVSKSLRLAHNSKKQSIDFDGYLKPLITVEAAELEQVKNSFKKQSSGFKVINDKLILRLNLQSVNDAILAIGSYKICNLGFSGYLAKNITVGFTSYAIEDAPYSLRIEENGNLFVIVHNDQGVKKITFSGEILL